MYKTCCRCKLEKEFKLFSKNIRTNDGLRIQCKTCVKEYRENNKTKIAQYDKNYYKTNKDKLAERNKQYKKQNPAKSVSKTAKRRAAKLQALPKWLTKAEHEEIKELYEITRMFKLYTGEEYHVDHIVPLQGENVCGLHVPWNLQVIPAKENLSKSNKLQEDTI